MNFDDKNIIEKSNKVIITNQLDGKSNNPSIISLVLGIISILFCWAYICSIITGIIGVITGCISLTKKRGSSNMAITGIVLSIVGFLFNVAFLFIFIMTLFMD